MDTYIIALGKREGSKTIENKAVTWPQLVKRLTKHTETANKGGAYFVGGHFKGNERDGEQMVGRSLMCLDIDKYDGDIDALAFDLDIWLGGTAYCAYSSWSHSADKPRVRVVLPLERELSPKDYRAFTQRFCEQAVAIPIEAFDVCSWKANQAMFLPQHPAGGEAWTMVGEGQPLPVDVIVDAIEAKDNLEVAVASQPLGLSDDEVQMYLDAYPAAGLDYDAWVRVGMGLFHEYEGAEAGLDKWLAWSKLDADRFDESDVRAKWKSFGGSANPVTMASIIWAVQDAGGIEAQAKTFDDLLASAGEVATLDAYDEFKRKIRAMNDTVLPPVRRAMLISELAEGFGKICNVGKVAIKKELTFVRLPSEHKSGGTAPDWARKWVYIESLCQFANIAVPDYSIRREAFNAKFDRMPECLELEKHASDCCLTDFDMRTFADSMFFPGAGQFFEYEGKSLINSYVARGVEPCAKLDADGQSVVDMLLAHIEISIEREDEQRILLDWLAYIYQNPGKRVGWAMFLQGAQGTGKTYFGTMLQELMGSNVRQLDTSAISGRFTGWAHGSLVTVVEEIRIAGASKWEIIDKLKPIISNHVIQIEEKGRDHRTVPNFTSYFLLSNHIDAIPIVAGDRRYCCILSRIQNEQQLFDMFGGREKTKQYFDRLFSETRRRPDAIARFLKDWKVSDSFDPIGRAPETSARLVMQNLSVSPEADAIEDAILKHQCEVINDEILDLTWLNKLIDGAGEMLPKKRAISTILADLGYRPIPSRRVKVAGDGYHYVWAKGAHKEGDIKSKIRNYHNGTMGIND